MKPDTPLDQLLQHIGWTRRGLAARLEVGDATIRRWEAGETAMPWKVRQWLTHLADAHVRHPTPTLDKNDFIRRIRKMTNTETNTNMDDDEDVVGPIMLAAGYLPRKQSGTISTWGKTLANGDLIDIASLEHGLDGEPDEEDWYVGRRVADGFGVVELDEPVTLAEALRIAERLPAPVAGVEQKLGGIEVEALG